jgi:hypothetical protein
MKVTYFTGIDISKDSFADAARTFACVPKNILTDSSTESSLTQRLVVGNYLPGSKSTGCPAQSSFESVFLCHGTHGLVYP